MTRGFQQEEPFFCPKKSFGAATKPRQTSVVVDTFSAVIVACWGLVNLSFNEYYLQLYLSEITLASCWLTFRYLIRTLTP